MSEKKKAKQKIEDEEEVTKEEYAVAKFLRFGLPVREGKMHRMEVKCFIASAAIDKLLESKWSSTNNTTDPLFTNRDSCINYMNCLLQKGLFHRADRDKKRKEKEPTKKRKKEKEAEKEKEEPAGEEEVRQRKSKKDKKSKKEKEEKSSTEKNKSETENKEEKKKDEKKKKEKRLKLLMSDEQWFDDGDEVYVWIYDPVNARTFVIGCLMVLGAFGLCLFPLWPSEVRLGVYYLSLAAAGFVAFILFLAVVRLILFCFVWLITLGRHHFWFLPNLTEDVGFFDSFRPLYHHERVSKDTTESDTNGKKKKKKKSSDSSKEKTESPKPVEKSSDKDDSDEFEVIKEEDLDDNNDELVEEKGKVDDDGDEGAAGREDDDVVEEEEEGEEEEDEDNDKNEESEDYEEEDGSEKEDKKTQ